MLRRLDFCIVCIVALLLRALSSCARRRSSAQPASPEFVNRSSGCAKLVTRHAALSNSPFISPCLALGITDRAGNAPADLHGRIFGAQIFAISGCVVKGPVPPRPEDLEMLLAVNNGM
jgi:hypothetical protein